MRAPATRANTTPPPSRGALAVLLALQAVVDAANTRPDPRVKLSRPPAPACKAEVLGTLHELALQSGTDKGWFHQFTLYYEHALDHLRTQRFSMLEIGVFKEASLQLWERFFPCAEVFGADRGGKYTSSRILRLDQSNPLALRNVSMLRNWTVVIDDGSHKPSHQLATFMAFFPRLRPGGVYIVEDIETSYWARGRGRGNLYGWTMKDETAATDAVARFHRAVHLSINREYFSCDEKAGPVFSASVDAMIGAITFVRNAILIRKAPRSYRRRPRYWGRAKQNCNESRFREVPLPDVESTLARRRGGGRRARKTHAAHAAEAGRRLSSTPGSPPRAGGGAGARAG